MTETNNNFDLLKELFLVLRGEIGQSVAKQHQILLTGYSMVALILGYSFGKDANSNDAAMAIPFVSLSMSSLWLVEASRMVRASNFIAFFVWPELEKLTGIQNNLNWEIYCYKTNSKLQKRYSINQFIGQMMVTVLIPFAISGFCVTQTLYQSDSKLLTGGGSFLFWIICILWCSAFAFIGFRIYQVSKLSKNDGKNLRT